MSTSKIDQLIHMLDDVDHRMRAIRKLESLGLGAKPAVNALWEKIILDLDGNPNEDVRVAALKTAATIDKGFSETVMRLLERLDKDKEPSWKVRVQAGLSLAEVGITVDGVMSRLKQLLNRENNSDVRRAIVGAMLSHGYDHYTLFDMALQTLQNANPDASPLSVDAALSIVDEMELPEDERAQALEAMWKFIRGKDESGVWQVFGAILEITSDDDQTLAQLLDDDQITTVKKSIAITHLNLMEHIPPQYRKDPEPILSILMEAVGIDSEWVSRTAEYRLQSILTDCPSDEKENILNRVQGLFEAKGRGLYLMFVYRPQQLREWIVREQPQERWAFIGHFLWNDARGLLTELWGGDDGHKKTVLAYILALIKADTDWYRRYDYLNWLRERLSEIPVVMVESVREVLAKLDQEADSEYVNRELIKETLDRFEKRSQYITEVSFIGNLKSGHMEGHEVIKKIKDAANLDSPLVLRTLVDTWVHWVIYNEQSSLIDSTADAIRYNRLAVLPLVDQLSKEHIPPIQTTLAKLEETAPQIAELLRRGNSRIKAVDEEAVRGWIQSFEDRSDAFNELLQNAKENGWPLKKQAEEIIQLLEREEQQKRKLAKNRRITRQLSDMSNKRFFTEAPESKYLEVNKEMETHAIPVLIRLLPNETDTEIREHLARTLGNLGGREAVDTLVRAVVDEEKKRAARQELLATYYLEPSKKQSEEAATILSGAVKDAKRTLRLLQGLNVAVFVVGMLLLLAGTLTSLYSQDIASRFIGGLAGLGGLAGVVVQLINNPLDRIQNAMANLVQIETAFTSFIWELNLNGTYIQSQYVAEGILTNDEITQTVGRIENAMSLAMNLVAVYTEEGRQRVVTRINSLSPAAGNTNNLITVHGQHLQGDNSQKKILTGIIAINHIPIQPLSLSWKEEAVRFKLPSNIPGLEGEAGTVWISLLIDGMETNALPYHVMKNGK